jgi:nucleoid DNA-binding protein
MAIQDEMFKLIEKEITETINNGKEVRVVNYEKAKEVALMLTNLSIDQNDAENLVNQYIANIKNICE